MQTPTAIFTLWRKTMEKFDPTKFVDKWFFFATTTTCFAVVLFALGVTAMSIATPRTISYCYTHPSEEREGNVIKQYTKLGGNIEWGDDAYLGKFESHVQAVEAAKQMRCPLLREENYIPMYIYIDRHYTGRHYTDRYSTMDMGIMGADNE